MKVVVADTSPLNYLLLIDAVNILPALYHTIYVPSELLLELLHPGSPTTVRQWTSNKPEWLQVSQVQPVTADPALARLDSGERAAIVLAEQQAGPVLLLIDDAAARAAANDRALERIGTLGILGAAVNRNLVQLGPALELLMRTNLRAPRHLIQKMTGTVR